MKITVFTCNQPRHNYLINKLSIIADKIYVIQEVANHLYLKKNKNKIKGNKNIIVLNILSRLVKKLKNKPIKLNANAPNIPNSNIL